MKCDNCGARLPAAKTPVVTCGYCGAEVAAPSARAAGEGPSSLLADRDGDGIPDIVQGLVGEGQLATGVTVQSTTRYEVNGQVFTSLEEMPPELRRIFEEGQELLAGRPAVASQQQVVSRVSNVATSCEDARLIVDPSGRARRVESKRPGWAALIVIALAVIIGLLLALLAR